MGPTVGGAPIGIGLGNSMDRERYVDENLIRVSAEFPHRETLNQ